MQLKHPGLMEKVKNLIMAAITGPANGVSVTAEIVTEIIATTPKDSGLPVVFSVTEAIDDVVSGAICGTIQVAGDLQQAATGIMIGVVRGTKKIGTESLESIIHTAQVMIRETSAGGGDLVAATTGLIDGAIAGAIEAGLSSEDAAMAAADGALKAAGLAGTDIADLVHPAVTNVAQHVKMVLNHK